MNSRRWDLRRLIKARRATESLRRPALACVLAPWTGDEEPIAEFRAAIEREAEVWRRLYG